MSGIGDFNWVQEYIGIPYVIGGRGIMGVDCFGLVSLVYAQELGIALPDFITDTEIVYGNFEKELEHPENYCIVRTPRASGAPDHVGVYLAGGVLSANVGGSIFLDLNRYLQRNPEAKYIAFQIPQELADA